MMERISIAVDISEEAREKAFAYLQNLRSDFSDLRIGWEKAEKLHLTLKFLGELDGKQITGLKSAVRETAKNFTKFDLGLKGTGVFPKPRNARILWIGVEDVGGNLSKIFESLEAECQKIGLPKESKSFHPHLTLARLREPEKSRKLVEKHLSERFEKIEFEVSEIVIYKSELLPEGSKYQKIEGVKLKK